MATVWDPAIYDPVERVRRGHDRVHRGRGRAGTDPATEIEPRARLACELNPTVDVGDVVTIPTAAGAAVASPASTRTSSGPTRAAATSCRSCCTAPAPRSSSARWPPLTTVLIATTVGSIAAYFGGWIDSGLMRFADLILLMPLLPVLILLSAMFEITMITLGVMIGILSGFGGVAIVLKSQALSIKVKPYIDAARVAGGSDWHVIFRHIVPNVLPLSFLYMMFGVTEAIAIEATLSFFGLLNVPMTWGHHDQHRADQRLPAQRHQLLVAALPGRPRRLVPVLRLLPGRPRHGRGDQPEAPRPVSIAEPR